MNRRALPKRVRSIVAALAQTNDILASCAWAEPEYITVMRESHDMKRWRKCRVNKSGAAVVTRRYIRADIVRNPAYRAA